MSQLKNTNLDKQYKALSFLSMLYLAIIVAANLLIYKLTHIGSVTVSAGTFIIPFWYMLGDIIAEVYGYQTARRLIWQTLLVLLIFSAVCNILIYLPAPAGLISHQSSFDFILGHLMRILLGLFFAVLVGSFLNAYCLTKWKVLLHGRFYWLRSLCSSAIGQLCFTFISIGFDLYRVVPFSTLIELVTVSYVIKLIFTPVAVIPSAYIVSFLKRLEGVDVFDTKTDFNPFKLKVETIDSDPPYNISALSKS